MPDAIWPRGIKASAADEDSHIVYARKDFPLHEMYDTDLSGLSAVQRHGRKRHVVLVHDRAHVSEQHVFRERRRRFRDGLAQRDDAGA